MKSSYVYHSAATATAQCTTLWYKSSSLPKFYIVYIFDHDQGMHSIILQTSPSYNVVKYQVSWSCTYNSFNDDVILIWWRNVNLQIIQV